MKNMFVVKNHLGEFVGKIYNRKADATRSKNDTIRSCQYRIEHQMHYYNPSPIDLHDMEIELNNAKLATVAEVKLVEV